MKHFSFEELSEAAQQNAINLYYADADYQDFVCEMYEKMPGARTVWNWNAKHK